MTINMYSMMTEAFLTCLPQYLLVATLGVLQKFLQKEAKSQ